MEYIKWRKYDDGMSMQGWLTAEEVIMAYEFVETVGHLVHENQDLIMLAMSREIDDKQMEHFVVIPKNSIEIRKPFTFAQLP